MCISKQYLTLLLHVFGFPCGSAGKESPAMWETWVQSLGQEDSPGEGIPTPELWLGEFHGLYGPWGHRESDRVTFNFTWMF